MIWQVVKFTSLSSETFLYNVTYEKFVLTPAKKSWEQRRCLQDFPVIFFACSSLFKISVFGLTRYEIWSWHNPPPAYFSLYKQSQSGKSSTQKMGINKERRVKDSVDLTNCDLSSERQRRVQDQSQVFLSISTCSKTQVLDPQSRWQNLFESTVCYWKLLVSIPGMRGYFF